MFKVANYKIDKVLSQHFIHPPNKLSESFYAQVNFKNNFRSGSFVKYW